MDFTIRAATLEDCKDIARMILVSGHIYLCASSAAPHVLSSFHNYVIICIQIASMYI